MKISTKLFLIGALISLGFGFISINTSSVLAQSNSFGNVDATQGVGVAGTGIAQQDSLITSVKTFINRVLGLLSLITLIILLRGGFQMVTAAGDDTKYKAGFKILKQAAFGLAFIGLSWLMVSLIFYVIGLVS